MFFFVIIFNVQSIEHDVEEEVDDRDEPRPAFKYLVHRMVRLYLTPQYYKRTFIENSMVLKLPFKLNLKKNLIEYCNEVMVKSDKIKRSKNLPF